MKRVLRSILSVLLAVSFMVGSYSNTIALANDTVLTTQQSNAIEMLNYITVLTQDINASKNSRVYMENAYSTLINNTYPNAVDSRTLSQLTGLLDTMESYRMVDVKRERLQYVYDQSQAQAIRAAIPNPVGHLSAVHSFEPVKLLGSIVYMAVDSVTIYIAYTSDTEKNYLILLHRHLWIFMPRLKLNPICRMHIQLLLIMLIIFCQNKNLRMMST